MPLAPIFQSLAPADLPIDSLFLDPNNPRFRTSNWEMIPDAKIDEPAVQEKATAQLTALCTIDSLRENMAVNGYLPIDRVVVRGFKEGKYFVLEGNRRIAAAKQLWTSLADKDNTHEIKRSITTIPCVVYTGTDSDAAWIFQGLRHITGFVDWSAFNKAKLLVEQMEQEALPLSDVATRFGITSHGAGQWMRGYYAFKQAQEESDYVDSVNEDLYPYIQELFSRSSASVREWLEWNEAEKKFKNTLNFNEYLSWFYPRDESDDDNADEATRLGEAAGDWNNRKISKRDQIRQIAYLITEAAPFFEQFRKHGDIDRAYSEARAQRYATQLAEESDPVKSLFDSLANCTKQLDNIPFRAIKDDVVQAKLKIALNKMEEAIKFVRG